MSELKPGTPVRYTGTLPNFAGKVGVVRETEELGGRVFALVFWSLGGSARVGAEDLEAVSPAQPPTTADKMRQVNEQALGRVDEVLGDAALMSRLVASAAQYLVVTEGKVTSTWDAGATGDHSGPVKHEQGYTVLADSIRRTGMATWDATVALAYHDLFRVSDPKSRRERAISLAALVLAYASKLPK